jgi:hypothetical protein
MADLLGDESFDWQKEWQGMPEFVQDDMKSIASLVVNFLTVEDMNAFSELIGKRITFTTKSVLFPVLQSETKKMYINEP